MVVVVSTEEVDAAPAVGEVTVYWRPGCPFCMSLRMGLKRSHTPFREVNIWDDREAAMFVRSVANGNETVPTVTVGDVALVNPSPGTVHKLAVEAGIVDEAPRRSWFGRHKDKSEDESQDKGAATGQDTVEDAS